MTAPVAATGLADNPAMSQHTVRPRIYLAGPDVFLANRAEVFTRLREACKRCGLDGIQPSDGDLDVDAALHDDQRAQRIYDANVALLRSCDGVIANLRPFRGLEPDPGTVFELGYAVALGKPVVGYGVPPGSYATRVAAATPCRPDAAGLLREAADGTMVEGLGQRLNLMLTRSTPLEDSAEAALRRIAALLAPSTSLTPIH